MDSSSAPTPLDWEAWAVTIRIGRSLTPLEKTGLRRAIEGWYTAAFWGAFDKRPKSLDDLEIIDDDQRGARVMFVVDFSGPGSGAIAGLIRVVTTMMADGFPIIGIAFGDLSDGRDPLGG